jgi:hypothetical protein
MSDPREVEINDPDDFSTSSRLQQIYQARQELRQMRQEAAQHRKQHPAKAVMFYRTAVESYLMELDTLFTQNDDGRELWNRKQYGTVTIAPPGSYEPAPHTARAWRVEGIGDHNNNNNNNALTIESKPTPKAVELTGLKSLFKTDSPIRVKFELETTEKLTAQTVSVGAHGYVPWTSLNQMVMDANSYVSDLGIGLDIDETDEWTI